MEKVSELILKGNLRLCQLAGIDPAEIAVPSIMVKLTNYGQKVNPGKELVVIFWERLTTTIPKAREFNL